MNTFFYFLRETFANLRRSKLLTTVSVITTGVLLFFLLAFSLVMINVQKWISGSQNQPQFSVYFDTQIQPSQEEALVEAIIAAVNPTSVNFISREESYEIFKNMYGSEMLATIDENPFPATLELAFSQDINADEMSELSQKISGLDGVESVVYSQDLLVRLRNFRDSVSRGIFVFASIMIAVVFFTIMNTVKLTVYARKDVIKNMQYVGASGWYIRMPFVLEGIIQGALGATIAVIVFLPARFFAEGFDIYWGSAQLFVAVIVFGAVLGFFGSFFAVKKFIKI